MKRWSKVLIILIGASGWNLAGPTAKAAPSAEASGAIRAIQQASDPSAVVAAYANGTAVDRDDPKLLEAYVTRMVDLALPELAYHQAQTLTTLESNNGLAWGVVAYVDARKGEMPEAVSAISLAGQAAPNNTFVQRTAGEIVAWYDTKAEKTKLADSTKEGLSKVRPLLEKEPAFTAAYNTARSAYQSQASAAQAGIPAAPSQYPTTSLPQSQEEQAASLGYGTAAPPPPTYYPDYYADWGPAWVEPVPWWWWQPVGFFGGINFFPFSAFVVFDDDFFFHHHHHFFHHDRDHFFHERSFHHDGLNVAFHDSNHAFFHRDGGTAFFGASARPNTTLALSARANFHAAPTLARSGFAIGGGMDPANVRPAMPGLTASPRSSAFAPSGTMIGAPSMAGSHFSFGTMPSGRAFGNAMAGSPGSAPRFGGFMPGQNFRAPAFGAPRMAPHGMMPMRRGFASGGFHGGFAGNFGAGAGFHGGGGGMHR